MAKPASKASLVRRIKALEDEIDDILSFHLLPVRRITFDQAYEILDKDNTFVTVERYARRYCLHDREIGQSKGTRYCIT